MAIQDREGFETTFETASQRVQALAKQEAEQGPAGMLPYRPTRMPGTEIAYGGYVPTHVLCDVQY
eukprot:2182914-Rhodomonas_salina.1